VPIKTDGGNPPIFLIHGAEGNVLLYRELAHYLGPNQPVYGLQSQGLDGRIPLQHDFETMAKNYVKEIKTVQPEGPYLLGGYCLGGTIAFEMAQQLHKQGEETALLAMFETYNIQIIPDSLPFYYYWYHAFQNVAFHMKNVLRINSKNRLVFLKQKMGVEWSRFKVMMNIAYSRIINKLRIGKGINYYHLLVDKMNDQAQEQYMPKTYAGRVTLFKPEGEFVGLNHPTFGWDGLAMKGVKVVDVPLSPKAILTEPFVQLFAKKLSEEIDWSLSNCEMPEKAKSAVS
jgi:thioesterase domain-containing protein